ncbi:MAG: hypothetical protein MJ014_00185 [Methanocorpusculum sp.]|nr:hypothetical protein [Methanocorpusculum sp.]
MTSYHNRNYQNWQQYKKRAAESQARRNEVLEWMLAQTANGEVLYEPCSKIAEQCGCSRQLVAATLTRPETAARLAVTKVSYRCYRIERRAV